MLVKKNGKALFVLRSNTGYKDNQYAVPSGHVEDGETFREAACRELMEEVGLEAKPEELELRAIVHRKEPSDIRIDAWFVARKWEGKPANTEPNKHSKIEWLELGNLPENVMDYISFGIDCIEQNVPYGEFGF